MSPSGAGGNNFHPWRFRAPAAAQVVGEAWASSSRAGGGQSSQLNAGMVGEGGRTERAGGEK